MSTACDICDKNFSTRSVLNRHLREVHEIETPLFLAYDFDRYNNKCFTCHHSFKYVKDLREHLTREHKFPLEVEELSFSNIGEFEEWLEETCKNDKVQYILTRGAAAVNLEEGLGKVSVYSCNRSGRKSTVRVQQRKRNTKTQGSNKLNFACTSQIKLTEIDGFCFATYYKTHYRHDRDLKHLPISKTDKEKIAQKLIAGIPTKEVLNEFRKSDTTESEDIQRINLITRKDINNIKKTYLNNGYRPKKKIKRDSNSDDEIHVQFSSDEPESNSDYKTKILSELQEITEKVTNNEIKNNVLGDVYELLQVASSILTGCVPGKSDDPNRIETYYVVKC